MEATVTGFGTGPHSTITTGLMLCVMIVEVVVSKNGTISELKNGTQTVPTNGSGGVVFIALRKEFIHVHTTSVQKAVVIRDRFSALISDHDLIALYQPSVVQPCVHSHRPR